MSFAFDAVLLYCHLADEAPGGPRRQHGDADYILARVRPEGGSRTLELNDPPNRWARTAGGTRTPQVSGASSV